MSFNLNNLGHLKQIITIVNKNPAGVAKMLAVFPFNQLEDLEGEQIEVLSGVVDVLALFVKYVKNFEEYKDFMRRILTFYIKTIDCHLNLDDCNFEFLEKLMKELLCGFQRCADVSLDFSYATLPNTLYSIANYPDVSKGIIQLTMTIFQEYIVKQTITYNDNFWIICTGIFTVACNSLDLQDNLNLVNVFISHFNTNIYPGMAEVYNYLNRVVKVLPKLDVPLIEHAMSCVMKAFKHCKEATFRKILSFDLVKIAFPKCIAHYFLIENKLPEMHMVLFNIIQEIFEETPWCSTETTLHNYIEMASTPFLIKRDPESNEEYNCNEFDFIVYYLESISNSIPVCRPIIINQILTTYPTSLPTNPAVLKSIFLIFPAHVGRNLTSNEMQFQTRLLLSLQHCDRLEHFITYHPAQLLWVLKYGSQILKRRVAACWVKQEDSDILTEFNGIIQVTSSQNVLIDVICHEDGDNLLSNVMIFLNSTMNYKKVLTAILTRSNLTIQGLSCILNAEPLAITLGPPDGPEFQSNLSTLCTIIPRLSYVFSNKTINLPEKTRVELLVYLCNSCLQLIKKPEAECFVMSTLVKAVAEATKSLNYFYAQHAFKLLSLIIITQIDLDIILPEMIIIEPVQLCGGDFEFVSTAVLFYLQVLHTMNSKFAFVSLKGNCLPLLLYLLEAVGIDELRVPNIYNLLEILLDRYDDCVKSIINICAIRMNCRNLNTSPVFVKYLTLWCSHSKRSYVTVPINSITSYVSFLDSTGYDSVDYLQLHKFIEGFKF